MIETSLKVVKEKISAHIASLPEAKQSDMQDLHQLMCSVSPGCKLWFDDGKNEEQKTVANPTIGYGFQTIRYADGRTRDFFRIGLSANTTGISVYILGLDDKKYLAETYGNTIGKASVTGYCIKFKKLKDIRSDVLEAAVRVGFKGSE